MREKPAALIITISTERQQNRRRNQPRDIADVKNRANIVEYASQAGSLVSIVVASARSPLSSCAEVALESSIMFSTRVPVRDESLRMTGALSNRLVDTLLNKLIENVRGYRHSSCHSFNWLRKFGTRSLGMKYCINRYDAGPKNHSTKCCAPDNGRLCVNDEAQQANKETNDAESHEDERCETLDVAHYERTPEVLKLFRARLILLDPIFLPLVKDRGTLKISPLLCRAFLHQVQRHTAPRAQFFLKLELRELSHNRNPLSVRF
jgi:hypothetical protein